jgi:DNA uptake protein ComE-like DNA-binding protein
VRAKVAAIQREEERIRAEADRRIADAERMERQAEAREARFGAVLGGSATREMGALPAAPGSELSAAPMVDVQAAEQRLKQQNLAVGETMEQEKERLRLIEERTQTAQRRAAEAEERLVALRAEELANQERLREMQESVDQAEERARAAERRASQAEKEVIRSLEAVGAPRPAPSQPPAPAAPPPGGGPTSAPPANPQPPPPSWAQVNQPPSPSAAGLINLNTATFEQLRAQNLTVTQATRLLAHRDRIGRFNSLADLNQVAGFPPEVMDELRRRFTV